MKQALALKTNSKDSRVTQLTRGVRARFKYVPAGSLLHPASGVAVRHARYRGSGVRTAYAEDSDPATEHQLPG